jgi:hypothetical protein
MRVLGTKHSFYGRFFYRCNVKNFNGADYFACRNEVLVTGATCVLTVTLWVWNFHTWTYMQPELEIKMKFSFLVSKTLVYKSSHFSHNSDMLTQYAHRNIPSEHGQFIISVLHYSFALQFTSVLFSIVSLCMKILKVYPIAVSSVHSNKFLECLSVHCFIRLPHLICTLRSDCILQLPVCGMWVNRFWF